MFRLLPLEEANQSYSPRHSITPPTSAAGAAPLGSAVAITFALAYLRRLFLSGLAVARQGRDVLSVPEHVGHAAEAAALDAQLFH